MKTPLYGLILGGGLGVFDGLSALVSAPEVAPQIVGIVVGSTIKGLLTGVLIGLFARRFRSLPLGLAFGLAIGLLFAYGVYYAGDFLHLSGIFAVITFGIALRYFERAWITLQIADDVGRFWDLAALAANAIVFFMVGASLGIGRVTHEPAFIAACLLGVAIARIAVAGLLLPAGFPRAWLGVVRVAGMRGALSLALALSIPASVAYRPAIVDATFAVVLATLLASSLTVPRAVARVAEYDRGKRVDYPN